MAGEAHAKNADQRLEIPSTPLGVLKLLHILNESEVAVFSRLKSPQHPSGY